MQPRIAFYGDDFTGSADVMEVLQWSGVPTILFMSPPNPDQLQAFGQFEAIGVAGTSRSMSPMEMESELTPVLQKLRESGARIIHYKTCSTFDSSPEIGSIGKAIEIGRQVFGSKLIPVMIGAPSLGRYQLFGNLFARSGLDTDPYRLDRHPTMMQHPITPMHESDVRIHLAQQTQLRLGLVDVLALHSGQACEKAAALAQMSDVLCFDVLYPEHLATIGAILEEISQEDVPAFMVGSSGIEYALTSYWARRLELENSASGATIRQPTFSAVDQLVVLTGSCSPVNERQIRSAQQHGFETLAIETSRLIDPQRAGAEIEIVIERAMERLNRGANLIVHSSLGPSDPRLEATLNAMRALGLSELEMRLQSGQLLGPHFGRILKGILSQRSFARVGIAGGDTSGFIARELGLTALEAIAPVAPGSPLCRAHAPNALDGVEFFFKGGQVGKDDVWSTMLRGSQL